MLLGRISLPAALVTCLLLASPALAAPVPALLATYTVATPPTTLVQGATAQIAVSANDNKVTLVNGVMVARLLGEATMVRHAAIRFLTDFRGRRLPRVWHV